MTLRSRNDLHLARRIWHVAGVLVIFTLYWLLTPRTAAYATLAASALLIGCDVARLYVPALNRIFTWIFGAVLRESERRKVSGITATMVGVSLIIWIYPKNVVLLALLFLAIADPLASYFGIRFGRDKLVGDKSLQGTLAAFAACFIISLVYFLMLDLMRERLFIVCLLSALIGAISELAPVAGLDDNFVFPVLSSTLLMGLFYVFGGL